MPLGTNISWFFSRLWRRRRYRDDVDPRFFPLTRSFFVAAGAVMVTIIFCILFLDEPVARFARSAPWPLHPFFIAITDFGKTGWLLMLSLFTLLIFAVLNWRRLPTQHALWLRQSVYDLAFVFYCIAVSGFLAVGLKNLVGRARPVLMDDHGVLHFSPATFTSLYASLPSGHSTTFGALSFILLLRFPRLWPLWFLLAFLGATSRVMVGAHYPSDAIAGLAFGAFIVWLTARLLAQKGLMFTFRPDSIIPRRRLPRQKLK